MAGNLNLPMFVMIAFAGDENWYQYLSKKHKSQTPHWRVSQKGSACFVENFEMQAFSQIPALPCLTWESISP